MKTGQALAKAASPNNSLRAIGTLTLFATAFFCRITAMEIENDTFTALRCQKEQKIQNITHLDVVFSGTSLHFYTSPDSSIYIQSKGAKAPLKKICFYRNEEKLILEDKNDRHPMHTKNMNPVHLIVKIPTKTKLNIKTSAEKLFIEKLESPLCLNLNHYCKAQIGSFQGELIAYASDSAKLNILDYLGGSLIELHLNKKSKTTIESKNLIDIQSLILYSEKKATSDFYNLNFKTGKINIFGKEGRVYIYSIPIILRGKCSAEIGKTSKPPCETCTN